MATPAFRFATPADAPAIAALIERAYRGPETAGQWDSESHLLTGPRTNLAEVAELLDRPDSRFVVCDDAAETTPRIIGCALIQESGSTTCSTGGPLAKAPYFDTFGAPGAQPSGATTSGKAAYFGMFATDPAIRAAGLGKTVLAEAEARARDLWNVPAMVMTVISVRSGLIAWYERRGYRLTGARIPFPFDENSGETTRDFDLVELRKDFA